MSTLRRRVRDSLPASVVARVNRARLLASLQRERWGRGQRRINDSISVPDLPRARRQAGAVWGVCLARNEEDIVEHTIRHMLDQGLDGIIVVDNMSTDRTRALLDELAATDPRVHVGVDRQVGFHQGGKVSYLAHLAWRAGPTGSCRSTPTSSGSPRASRSATSCGTSMRHPPGATSAMSFRPSRTAPSTSADPRP